MSKKRHRSTAGPVALIGSLAAGNGRSSGRGRHRKRSNSLEILTAAAVDGVRAIPDQAKRMVAGPLPKGLAKRIPNRRKRKALAKRLRAERERIEHIAGGVGTALGMAATGAEIWSALRDRHFDGADATEPEEEEDYEGESAFQDEGDVEDESDFEDADAEDESDFEDEADDDVDLEDDEDEEDEDDEEMEARRAS